MAPASPSAVTHERVTARLTGPRGIAVALMPAMSVLPLSPRPIHACAVFDTPAEQLRVMSQHLSTGLAAGQRALGLIEHGRSGELTEALEVHGVDVGGEVARGALRVRSASSAYLPDGSFDPARTIQMVADAERDALLAGYRGLCAAADMTWALGGAPGTERLAEYEYLIGRTVYRRLNVVGVCQYDATRFSAEELRLIRGAHSIQVATGRRTMPRTDGSEADILAI